MDGRLIKEFESESDAGRQLNIAQTDISRCCRGERKSAGGFQWRYVKDFYNKTCSPIKRRNDGKSKQIAQFTLDGQLIQIYESAHEAARINNFPSVSSLCNAARNYETKTYHGYK